jgi:3-methyladenine DNA glycosylase/8-oxoguanine DNA glycosylase
MTPDSSAEWRQAAAHISRNDPAMARLVRAYGPCTLRVGHPHSPFAALLGAIVSQQLATRAAATIHGRLLSLFPRRRPSPRVLLGLSDADLRGAGLSRNKMLAVRDLAMRCRNGSLPGRAAMQAMDDEAVIERLVAVRGIGRWTAEMLLIFCLGRPDILPVDDLGIRRGCQYLLGLPDLPDARALTRHAHPWRPYRSVACWYLWRLAENPGLTRPDV